MILFYELLFIEFHFSPFPLPCANRAEQDLFALRSHQLAAKAIADGHIAKELVSVNVPPKFNIVYFSSHRYLHVHLNKISIFS